MEEFVPSFDEINNLEANSLQDRWQVIKYAIGHSGEKGAAAEFEVVKLLREILPAEYGLTTGFIAYHNGEKFPRKHAKPSLIKRQLDVIIYDAIRCCPLVNLGACSVVPLESVYAYVEVKGCLHKKNIGETLKQILEQSRDVRSHKNRFYYRPEGSVGATPTSCGVKDGVVSVESFVVCLDSEKGLKAEKVRATLEAKSKELRGDTFITGMLVLDDAAGFYCSHAVDPHEAGDEKNQYKVCCRSKDHLAEFKWRLIDSLTRFPRIPQGWTPALDTYSGRSMDVPHSTHAFLHVGRNQPTYGSTLDGTEK